MFLRFGSWWAHVEPEGHPGADPEYAEGADMFWPEREYLRIPWEQGTG